MIRSISFLVLFAVLMNLSPIGCDDYDDFDDDEIELDDESDINGVVSGAGRGCACMSFTWSTKTYCMDGGWACNDNQCNPRCTGTNNNDVTFTLSR